MTDRPRVSVIIPTYNRVRSLERVLTGLSQQAFPADQFEVVVISDGSTDDTPQLLQAWEARYRLISVFQENQGPAVARNLGVAQSTGDLILFLDDDVVPVAQLLTEHVRVHKAQGPRTVVIGPMLPPTDHRMPPWVRWSQERLGEQYHAMETGQWLATARQFYTGNASLRRGHMLAAGGFDASFKRAEDVELAYRLADFGLNFVFCSSAAGYHYEERSFAAWLEIPYHYGRSDVAFTYEKGQAWLLPKIFTEMRGRSWFVRMITRLCLDQPGYRQRATRTLHSLAIWGSRLRLSILVRLACSSLFNLYHYQGIADGLGGRDRFFALAAGAYAS